MNAIHPADCAQHVISENAVVGLGLKQLITLSQSPTADQRTSKMSRSSSLHQENEDTLISPYNVIAIV